jgi:hypothetical protein
VSGVLNLSRKSQIKIQTLLSVISRSSLRALRNLAKQSASLIEIIPQFKKQMASFLAMTATAELDFTFFKFYIFQVSKPAVE